MITNNLSVGILAHVDAGKTTLAEALLYLTGSIRQAGRVDHGDAHLDTDAIERERGITIFSKTARINIGEKRITLLDTPGHVDFSAEAERTLQVMDYAILVINGMEGVQGHTKTLWELLKRHRIPVFLFVNKMDRAEYDGLPEHLSDELDSGCIDFSRYLGDALAKAAAGKPGEEALKEFPDELQEAIALCDEKLLDGFLEGQRIGIDAAAKLIRSRKVFPCFYGSALKMEGVKEFISAFNIFAKSPDYKEEFGAKAFKISRDEKGGRLTWLKLTGGTLKVRDELTTASGEKAKINQIRLYSGEDFLAEQEVTAGEICAVTGLENSEAGDAFGAEKVGLSGILEPVLSYSILPPDGMTAKEVFLKIRELAYEAPELGLSWREQTGEIRVNLMGEVQIEVLERIILERFGLEVGFDAGAVIYKETVANAVEGIGHFEPLRHYAEAHVLIEPGERGSGIKYDRKCSEDQLDRNWQRLILTHLRERTHPGVLTGSALDDVRLTVVAGRAHTKHTEGGDFREATYRAVRQGLKSAECILLEPVFGVRLEVPTENVGRAMHDLDSAHGSFEPPGQAGEMSILVGKAPVACLRDYATEVAAYTGGRGRLQLTFAGYEPCHNAAEVIEGMGYDSEADTDNPTSSVFCSKGTAQIVPWNEVPKRAHVVSEWSRQQELMRRSAERPTKKEGATSRFDGSMPAAYSAEDKELQEIFARTYRTSKADIYERGYLRGPQKPDAEKNGQTNPERADDRRRRVARNKPPKERYLLVDGYNIIFAWQELRDLMEVNIDSARDRLMDMLSNYQGFRGMSLILVFDAYKVKGGTGSVLRYHNIDVVFTREAQTADAYIEMVTKELAKDNDVTVATSDGVEQMIIWGHGARRMSAGELFEDMEAVNAEIEEILKKR